MGGDLRVPDYLGHILQAIRRIGRYAGGMDEAARNIERTHPDFSARHPDVPWGDI